MPRCNFPNASRLAGTYPEGGLNKSQIEHLGLQLHLSSVDTTESLADCAYPKLLHDGLSASCALPEIRSQAGPS